MNQELISKIFVPEIKKKTDALVARYETRRASILEVLRLLMDYYGHLTLEIEEAVAAYLGIPPIDVREVVTFYTLFYTAPKAKKRFNVCRTLSCHLMGSDKMIRYLENKLGIKTGEMTPDGEWSLHAVECLGACEIAPMLQFNDDRFCGHLTEKKLDELIESAKKGEQKTSSGKKQAAV
ncbi:MAG: hypothetical protein A2Z83_04775 [Omnitrophica bacterium GWA2_52_8]|nr:MAG: hypothetical protein A2Z83_04775 [Omnitrophica bacterium GWA2_52_8]